MLSVVANEAARTELHLIWRAWLSGGGCVCRPPGWWGGRLGRWTGWTHAMRGRPAMVGWASA